MGNERTGSGEAAEASQRQFAEQPPNDDAIREDCTLAFQGKLNLSDDEAGSDPYNRTGRFQRIVR